MNDLYRLLGRAVAALVFTIIVECGLCALAYRKKRIVVISFWANIMTNPALNLVLVIWNFCFPYWGIAGYIALLAVLETAAVVAEAYAYIYAAGLTFQKAIATSSLLNVASFMIYYFFEKVV